MTSGGREGYVTIFGFGLSVRAYRDMYKWGIYLYYAIMEQE